MTDDGIRVLAKRLGMPKIMWDTHGFREHLLRLHDATVATERQRIDVSLTPAQVDAIYAAWHGAGVDIAGGNWNRFVGMLPVVNSATQGETK